MNILDWIPALSTASLVAVAVWLGRSMIAARLTKSVENEFSSKLEALKSDLRAKEAAIESLRTAAMSGLISRQAALYERRVEAVEQLWEAATELGKAKFVSASMSIARFDEAAKEAPVNPNVRKFFATLGGGFDAKSLNLAGAAKARPFVSPLAWAYFNALRAIVMMSALKLEALKIGIEKPEKYFNVEGVNELVKKVLPHQRKYIDKYGHSALHYLVKELEELLLTELQNILRGVEADQENAQRAAEILGASDKLVREMQESRTNA